MPRPNPPAPVGRRPTADEVHGRSPDILARFRALKDTVLQNIGRPDDLVQVKVHRLHDDNHYRVNIYRELAGYPKLTDSYYVKLVHDGLVSSPPMERKYYDDILREIPLVS